MRALALLGQEPLQQSSDSPGSSRLVHRRSPLSEVDLFWLTEQSHLGLVAINAVPGTVVLSHLSGHYHNHPLAIGPITNPAAVWSDSFRTIIAKAAIAPHASAPGHLQEHFLTLPGALALPPVPAAGEPLAQPSAAFGAAVASSPALAFPQPASASLF